MDLLSKNDLQTLLEKQDGYCLSIFMPTFRAGKKTQQNSIRFKNLLAEAKRRLLGKGLRPLDVEAFLQPAYNLYQSNLGQAVIEDTPGKAYGVAISGHYAYVADFKKGLQIIDISDPSSPRISGSFDTEGYALAVDISGGYAYVADGRKGLLIIDIQNPKDPKKVGCYNTEGNALSVTVSGHYAYVAIGGIGLKIIDIRYPFNALLVGTHDTTGNILGVAVSGRYVFMADGYSGIQIMRIIPTPCPSLIFVNASTLRMTVPGMLPAGFYDIVVKNPNGETARLQNGFQSLSLSKEARPGSI